MKDTILVSDPRCEEYVLGTIMNNKNAYNEVAEFLDSDCFTDGVRIGIWDAIVSVSNQGLVPEIINVSAELSKEGLTIQPYDIAIIADKTLYIDLHSYALRLRDLSMRRKMWYLSADLKNAGEDETTDIDEVRQKVVDGINGLFGKSSGIVTLGDSIKSLNDRIAVNLSGKSITGTSTGFSKIDIKGGLQKSDLIIVAGETSNGKTSLALSITKNAILSGSKVAFYSLEMTKEQLSARLISSICGSSSSKILYSPDLSTEELEQIDKAIGQLPGDNLYFDDNSTSSIDSILLSIRSMKLRYNIDGAVVDYLQIVGTSDKRLSREQQMGEASRRLKNIAKELGIWVIALSQLNRDPANPVPNLNRLRDSGQIAEAADVVILIYRPEYYRRDSFPAPFEDSQRYPVNGKAFIDVAKGRNIGTFQFLLDFKKETTSFIEPEDNIPPPTGSPFAIQEEDAPF